MLKIPLTAPETFRMFSGVSKKTVRIEALATKAEAKVIRSAADAERLSVSAYVIKAALEKATPKVAA